MITPSHTGFCTVVFTHISQNEEDYVFKQVEFSLKHEFGQQPVDDRIEITDEKALIVLDDIEVRNRADKLVKREPINTDKDTTSSITRRGVAYRNKINNKRAKVAELIHCCEKVNLSKIARLTRMTYESVRTIYNQIRLKGDYEVFNFNHQHSLLDQETLENDLDHIEEGFSTVKDIKNRNPSFSKKYIMSLLHKKRYRWRMVPRAKREEKQKEPNSENICSIIRILTYCHYFDDISVLYIDEMKLPLFQTPTWHWKRTGSETHARYGIRPLTGTITAIAMCSIYRFEAVQLFTTEVNTIDFTFFLENAIQNLPVNKRYIFLLDNATWHQGRFIQKSKACRYLLFNEPRQFRLNMIENSFSYVRSLYRRRIVTDDIKEETKSIISIFFGEDCTKKFAGFFRNHVRQLKIMMVRHKKQTE